jgi:cysteine desulfurase
MKGHKYYFDHAATTPLDPKVFSAMLPYLRERYGNPSNLYELGRDAKSAISKATEIIAGIINCHLDEFIYTGSATEADNLAIIGTAHANRKFGNRIIVSSIEHKGIMAACESLEKEGFEIITIPVKKNGLIDLDALEKSLNEKTILVSITYADSETGTIQPIKEIAKIIERFRNMNAYRFATTNMDDVDTSEPPLNVISRLSLSGRRREPYAASPMAGEADGVSASSIFVAAKQEAHEFKYPLFHTDASQAVAYLDINIKHLGIDLMTLSAHKFGGPKGIGGLYIRNSVNVEPIIHGGGQQGKLRGGTENVPAIVGFAEALRLNNIHKKDQSIQIKKMRDALENGIFKSIPKIVLNGHPKKRLPNYLNISILDIEGEAILLHLDRFGIMVGTGSACNSQSLEPSYVLTAIGNPYEYIHGSIRFTLGKENVMKDVNYVLKHLPGIVKGLRAISPLELKLGEGQTFASGKTSIPKAFIGNQTPHFLRKKK